MFFSQNFYPNCNNDYMETVTSNTRHARETRNLEMNNHIFENVINFKYLGVNINYDTNGHEEIRLIRLI